MGRILMSVTPSLEELFALWLVRGFGVESQGFRNARVVYRQGTITAGFRPTHNEQEILMLYPGCLKRADFWMLLEITQEYREIISQWSLAIGNGLWVRDYENQMRESRMTLPQLIETVSGIFSGSLARVTEPPKEDEYTLAEAEAPVEKRQLSPSMVLRRQYPKEKQRRRRKKGR